jgi:hypothetical protein
MKVGTQTPPNINLISAIRQARKSRPLLTSSRFVLRISMSWSVFGCRYQFFARSLAEIAFLGWRSCLQVVIC